MSSVAAGTLAGMLLAGAIRVKRRGITMLGGTTVLGFATALVGFLPGLLPVAALLVIMGSLSGFINVQIQAWFQQRVDRAVLGRVASLTMLAAFGLMPLSMAAAGVAVSWSAKGTFIIAGIAVMMVSHSELHSEMFAQLNRHALLDVLILQLPGIRFWKLGAISSARR